MLAMLGQIAFGSVAGWSMADIARTHWTAGSRPARILRRVAYAFALAAFPATAAAFGGLSAATATIAGLAGGVLARLALAGALKTQD